MGRVQWNAAIQMFEWWYSLSLSLFNAPYTKENTRLNMSKWNSPFFSTRRNFWQRIHIKTIAIARGKVWHSMKNNRRDGERCLQSNWLLQFNLKRHTHTHTQTVKLNRAKRLFRRKISNSFGSIGTLSLIKCLKIILTMIFTWAMTTKNRLQPNR